MQCFDAWSMGGAPGQGDVAGGGALGSWCMRGWAKQAVSQGSLSRRKNSRTNQGSRNLPQHATFKNGVVTILSPRPRSLTSEGCVGKEGRTMGVLSPCTVSPRPNVPSNCPRRGYGSVPRRRHSLITGRVAISPTHRRSASTSRVFKLQGDST